MGRLGQVKLETLVGRLLQSTFAKFDGTLSMVYKGQREIAIVLAPNFFAKIP